MPAVVMELDVPIPHAVNEPVTLEDIGIVVKGASEAMAGVGSADNAFAQLNRFEQTVSKEEATAKAFDQLASAGTDNDLEKEFAQLGTHGVDSELAALKAERQKATLPPPPYIAKELPPAGGSFTAGTKAGEKAGA